jgi:hypothetical protein
MRAIGRNTLSEALRFVLLTISFFELFAAQASPSLQIASANDSRPNERAALKSIWLVLKSSEKVGRIYYTASCPPDNLYPLAMPKIELHSPPRSQGALDEIRGILRNNKDITVTENEEGVIRIVIGSVPSAILNTRIAILTLDPMSQYNYPLAIDAIEKAPEVQSAMDKLKIHVPARPFNVLMVQPAEGRAHLPATIADVTMDQALDLVAKAFKGIVLYGACPREPVYEVSFVGGAGLDDSSL